MLLICCGENDIWLFLFNGLFLEFPGDSVQTRDENMNIVLHPFFSCNTGFLWIFCHFSTLFLLLMFSEAFYEHLNSKRGAACFIILLTYAWWAPDLCFTLLLNPGALISNLNLAAHACTQGHLLLICSLLNSWLFSAAYCISWFCVSPMLRDSGSRCFVGK